MRAARQRGAVLVEAAITFPLLLMAAMGLMQFALFYHAQTVVAGATQDGARTAAADGATVDDGVHHAQELLTATLGQTATVTVQGRDLGNVVTIAARGQLHMVIPWVADATLPLQADAVMSKERFRVGPSS
ncbi:MAG: pilus assembly protein [Chloroflexota bacterium]|nr:pilus assembly protein [Chloroflexota bacterium]